MATMITENSVVRGRNARVARAHHSQNRSRSARSNTGQLLFLPIGGGIATDKRRTPTSPLVQLARQLCDTFFDRPRVVHRAEFRPAHPAELRALEVLVGQGRVVHRLRRVGVEREPELLLPIEGIPCARESVVAVARTILAGILVARAVALGSAFATLTGGAVAICGASAALAIASILPQHRHAERDASFTVIGVTAFSTLAMILYPIDWLEERSGLVGGVKYFLFRKVPGDINWFQTLGSATLTAFPVQALTGVILAMYYKPDPNSAYPSIQHITNDVFAGWLVRGMHRWGASVFIILMFMHMGRVFLFGAYKYPRELNWIVGVLILGQKLPMWGEIFGWSLVVSTALARPLVSLTGVLLEGSLKR